VLADLSGHMTPIQWAKAAIAAYQSHKADRIVRAAIPGVVRQESPRFATLQGSIRRPPSRRSSVS
jgi:hypothetical protein